MLVPPMYPCLYADSGFSADFLNACLYCGGKAAARWRQKVDKEFGSFRGPQLRGGSGPTINLDLHAAPMRPDRRREVMHDFR